MNRLRRGWLRRALKLMRWSRVLAYLLVGAAGAVGAVSPPVAIQQGAGGFRTITLTWAVLMAVAASFCAWGAASDRWVGEYIGLIPLSLVAFAFGVGALSRGTTSFAGGLFLIGFFWILVARWQEVALLRTEAARQVSRRNGEGASPPDREGHP